MLSLLALVPLLLAPGGHDDPPPPAPALRSVEVLGASVTAGFGLASELEVSLELGELLALALGEDAGRVRTRGSSLFFQDPGGVGGAQVEAALEGEPTLVVALDYLFWFGYGYHGDCEARLRSLDRGLALLARFTCPVVVGDLPDMSAATEGASPLFGGRALLAPAQVPDAACRARLNARLREWAAARANVRVFDLERFAREVRAPGTLELRGNRWDPERKAALVQPDLLHTTLAGSAALLVVLCDELARAELVVEERVLWDAQALVDRALEHTAEAREKRRARRLRLEELRRAREEADRGREQGSSGDGARAPFLAAG
jgi:hypothetical protein